MPVPPLQTLRRRARRLGRAWLCLAFCLAAVQADATERPDTAQQRGAHVAQIVQGILSYARWPGDPEQLRLCVVAPTQYADALLGSQADEAQRPVQVRRLLLGDTQLEDSCEAVYIGVLTAPERKALLARLVGKPILTIGETLEPCSEGGLFCLRVEEQRTSFEVNLDSVSRSGIRIHPNVLRLGKRQQSSP